MSNRHGPCSFTMGLFVNCMIKAYGTAKSGVGIASMGVMRPDMIMSLALTIFTRFSTKNCGRSNSSVLLQCLMILMPNYFPLPISFTLKTSCKHQQDAPRMF